MNKVIALPEGFSDPRLNINHFNIDLSQFKPGFVTLKLKIPEGNVVESSVERLDRESEDKQGFIELQLLEPIRSILDYIPF